MTSRGAKSGWHISGDALAVLFLSLFPFVYFWQVTIGQGVWMTTDILRLFYPFGVELARALDQGRLPLWTPGLAAGFPLLAEGQMGALYPINWLLYKLLLPHIALSYAILLHLAFAGCGMFIFVRSRGLAVPGALCAGLVFSFSGVMLAQMFHPPIVFTMAWLPWLIYLQARYQTSPDKSKAMIGFGLTALALGVHFLGGSMQMAFLNTLIVALFGVLGRWLWNGEPSNPRAFLQNVITTTLLVLWSGGLAAIQLIPTTELVDYSVRSGGLDTNLASSYSLPPSYLSQFIAPFAQGEPAEGNEEYRAYFGIAPLVLSLGALFLRRNRQTFFFAGLALGALALALGEANPIYQFVSRLPVFNFFRVPARYLHVLVFTAAFLSALGINALLDRLSQAKDRATHRTRLSFEPTILIGVFVLLVIGSIGLAYTQSLAFWLNVWQALPIVFVVLALGVLWLGYVRKIGYNTFAVAVISLTIFDLTSHAPPFLYTLDALTPTSSVTSEPRALQSINETFGDGRVFTDEAIFPSPPAIRNSLFPNTALIYGRESAQIYSSLAIGRHQAYIASASPAMLNLMNVRYFAIPLEPRSQTKRVIPPELFALDVMNNEQIISPTPASAIEIVSFTEAAENVTVGTTVGQVDVRWRDGRIESFALRVGIETADWDYARKNSQHQSAEVVRAFPAYWRAYGRSFEGHIYLARFNFSRGDVIGINVRVLQPQARLTIESITLRDDQGQARSVANLTGKNDFQVAYLSDTVAIWKNLDAMPRAFVVHSAEIVNDDLAFAHLQSPGFDPASVVLLADGITLKAEEHLSNDAVKIIDYQPERVRISVTTDQAGYLVLADAWYPGWNAFVDGQPASIYRADVLFRAVRIEPGAHTVVFEYRPGSFVLGAVISIISVLTWIGVSLFYLQRRKPDSNV